MSLHLRTSTPASWLWRYRPLTVLAIAATVLCMCPRIRAADRVELVHARSPDGKLNADAAAHDVRYMTWSGATGRGRERLGHPLAMQRKPQSEPAVFVSLKAPRPGDYTLTLTRLYVHLANRGGRHVGVWVVPEPQPRRIIKQLLDGRDAASPRDYPLTLKLTAANIRNGHIMLMLRGTAPASASVGGVWLEGRGSSDGVDFTATLDSDGNPTDEALGHDLRYVERPVEDNRPEPWNLGSRGVGLGSEAAYGHLLVKLRPEGVGRHVLRLHGIEIPDDTLPGTTVLMAAGRAVVCGSVGADQVFETELEVGPDQFAAGAVEVRIDPVLGPPVYVKTVSLEPKGELGKLVFLEQADRCIVWATPVFGRFRPGVLPPDPQPEPVLAMHGARNEWVSACWNVTNFLKSRDEPLTVHCEMSDLEGPGGTTWNAREIDLFSLEHVQAGHDNTPWAKQKVYQGMKPQPQVSVPVGETRQMWMVGRLPKSIAPGNYQGTFRVSWPGGETLFPVHLRVWDFSLPDESPLAVSGWLQIYYGHLQSPEGQTAQVIRDFYEHYGNVLGTGASNEGSLCSLAETGWDKEGNLAKPLDLSNVARVAKAARKYRMRQIYFYGGYWQVFNQPWHREHTRSSPRLAYDSPAMIHAARQVLDQIVRVCEEAGLSYGDWMLYPYDEYLGEVFVRAGKVTRAVDPKIRIFANKCDDIHDMRAALPYVDIWCPYKGHIVTDEDGERMAMLRASGKPLWSYTATAYRGVPALAHREHAWFTFEQRLDGIGTWHYFGLSHGMAGDPREVGLEPGQDGWWVIPSPRLLAWTDGIEDHMYLTMLDRYATSASDTDSGKAARRMLEEAVAAVLSDARDADVYLNWTRRLGEMIEQTAATGARREAATCP